MPFSLFGFLSPQSSKGFLGVELGIACAERAFGSSREVAGRDRMAMSPLMGPNMKEKAKEEISLGSRGNKS